MAARKNSGTKDSPWSERTRERIQTSMLVNRLTQLVKGEVEMPPHAVTAALGLLAKTLPSLASQEVKVTDATPYAIIPDVIQDDSEWRERFAPKAKTEH